MTIEKYHQWRIEYESDYDKKPTYLEVWKAAKAESEKEVAELKQELKESDDLRESMSKILTDTANALKGTPDELTMHSWHDLAEKATELTASNNKLREALDRIIKADENVYNCEDDYQGDKISDLSNIHFKAYNKARKLLNATPAQSLIAHDNEVIDHTIRVLLKFAKDSDATMPIDDAYKDGYLAGVYDGVEAIRAMKGENK